MNTEPEDLKKVLPMDEQAEFVLSFVDDSDDKRSDLEDIWNEVDDNYLVRPPFEGSYSNDTRYPLDANLVSTTNMRNRNAAILKDPETHQEIMTLLATITLSAFPVGGGFVSASAVGFEDIPASTAWNGLSEHAFRQPGHYWAQMMRLLYALLRGTGVVRWTWEYREEMRPEPTFNPFSGELQDESNFIMRPVWNDPLCRAIDTRDFYPDHGQELLIHAQGAAEHYRMTAADAMRKVASGVFDEDSVMKAIARKQYDIRELDAKRSESAADVSPAIRSDPDFMELDVYEYYGETPFRGSRDDPEAEDGIQRRVISVMNGETARSRPWPRRLPYSEVKIIPRPGSFWGMSVGELVRYDQDFADTIKMMLADAVVRMTHPPHIYDKNAEVDLRKLRQFNPRVPIGASRTDAIKTLDYSPQLGDAFLMYSGVKGQMRDASTAVDSLQGQAGPNRESATVGSLRYTAAQTRPELFAALLEREWLPNDGRIVLELNQEFLRGDAELLRRIGQSEIPVSIENILGDFDIEFTGSRQESNRVQKLESFREINAAAAANPVGAANVPWIMLYRKWFKDLGEEEIAAMVGNPEVVQEYIMRSTILQGQFGNGNGETPGAPPLGAMPAQMSGTTV